MQRNCRRFFLLEEKQSILERLHHTTDTNVLRRLGIDFKKPREIIWENIQNKENKAVFLKLDERRMVLVILETLLKLKGEKIMKKISLNFIQ